MRLITLDQLQRAVWKSEQPMPPEDFERIANDRPTYDERMSIWAMWDWFERRYPTPADRWAYNNRAMRRLVRPMSVQPTAMVTEAWVGKGGAHAEPKSPGSVHIVLMNVLRWTDTDFETRRDLLYRVIQSIDCSHKTVILAPAGYFGWDTCTGYGRFPVRAGDLDRNAVRQFLNRDLVLPDTCLLAVGLDDVDAQHLLILGQETKLEITRGQSSWEDRRFSFGGLSFFGTICYEFRAKDGYGPMYAAEPRYFDAERDIKGRGIDVVLNAAHIMIKCSQRENAELQRFPFERFMIGISQAGAACFLAHHHPGEKFAPTEECPEGIWKNHSYSNWGIFSGQGLPSDWMPNDTKVTIVDIE